ncbi:MAG: primosomal protein N' [Acidobacteriota bacterium]
MPRLASVAVPVPHLDLLTYGVPAEFPTPHAGARVLVPLGTRTVTGCVAAVQSVPREPATSGALRDILDLLDDGPYLPEDIVKLALWVSDYYACAPGEAVAAAAPPMAWIESRRVVTVTPDGQRRLEADDLGDLPPLQAAGLRVLAAGKSLPVSTFRSRLAAKLGRPGTAPGGWALRALERAGLVNVSQLLGGQRMAYRTTRVAELTPQGQVVAAALRDGASVEGLGPRQREALRALAAAPDGLPTSDMRDRRLGVDGLHRLALRGLLTVRRQTVERDPFAGPWGRDVGGVERAGVPTLTPQQELGIDRLVNLLGEGRFRVALLHGVTGSGKTEVYLRLAAWTREHGRQALILVPEIALTPVMAALFRGRFGPRVAIQHSGLSDGERHDQWQRIRQGAVDVVVGTRSAVFAPVTRLGLIVIDEEHDGSYKQDDTPRYNGRDVAIVRARDAGALAVLGSATPSLESFHHARAGRYELVSLDRRVCDRPLARVSTVDMRQEFAEMGPGVVLSRPMVDGIRTRIGQGEQVLLLLNRRGLSTAVFCRQCGGTVECPNCDVSLVVHGRGTAVCHYCNYGRRVPRDCPTCGGSYLEQMGFGTERVEAEVRTVFPDARVGRLDRDAVRRRGAMTEVLARFAKGDLDVLVGTQMIAKGHDFPRVTLVGVISADVGLGLADFRAAERTFQLLTQVVGRAGRGDRPGEAVVQTLYPDHYSIRHACSQDYGAFVEEELRYRRAMRYPPIVALVNAIVRGPSFGAAMASARHLVEHIGRAMPRPGEFQVLGPAPAPLARLRGEHRAQFFLKGRPSARTHMRRAVLAAIAAHPELRRRVSVDIDPISVL